MARFIPVRVVMLTACLAACSRPPSSRVAHGGGADSIDGGRPAILARGEGEHRLLQGYRPLFITVDPLTVGSPTLMAGLSDIAPGDSIPVHKHLGEEEILFIHRGAVEVTLGDETRPAAAGATVFIPRGTWVGLRVVGTDTATTLSVFSTPAFEKCLRAQSVRPGESFVRPSAKALEAARHECHQVRKAG